MAIMRTEVKTTKVSERRLRVSIDTDGFNLIFEITVSFNGLSIKELNHPESGLVVQVHGTNSVTVDSAA